VRCSLRTYVVERAELGRGLVQAGVGREDGAATLTLVPDNTTHGDGVELEVGRSFSIVVEEDGCDEFVWVD
jgi:hypothetical protein